MILYFKKSSNIKKKINKYLLIFLSICFSIVFFFCFGIYFANTEWFNNHIYIRNKQMQLLNTKSSWKLEKELFNASYSYELYDIAEKLYTNYHEYYLKVTKNILESEWTDNVEKEEFMLYVKDYEKRKKQMRCNQTHSKGSYKQNGKITYRLRENICKVCNRQWLNFQNK